MKKAIFGLFWVGMVASAVAQGTVTFNNYLSAWNTGSGATYGPAPGQPDRLVYADYVGGTKLIGTNWVAQLYFAPGVVSDESLLSLTTAPSGGLGRAAFRADTTSAPGTWHGGTRILPGVDLGQTATLQVRVWDYTQFATFEDALAAVLAGQQVTIGRSSLFQYTVPTSSTPADRYMDGLRAFVVPEPSGFALLGLGAAVTLIFRRRNRG